MTTATRRLTRGSITVAILVAAVALWPARFGGWSTLVVVQGNSMEPTFHTGDLLYVRESNSYSAGEVVVYRVPTGTPGAGLLIVHRVRRRLPDGTFVFQGDHRAHPDDARPRLDDLVGTEVADLGPLPTRAILLLPLLAAAGLGLLVTRELWPDELPRRGTI